MISLRPLLQTGCLIGMPFLPLVATESSPPPTAISLAEAIEITLAQQPGVEISRLEVVSSEGELQQARGQFDWVLGGEFSDEVSQTPTGTAAPFPTEQRQDIAIVGVGAAKQLRNGVIVSPQVSVVDIKDSLSSPIPASRSDVRVTVTVPLLRGRGVESTGAIEKAAEIQVEAQQHLARAQLEQFVYQTAVAYWNCLAAQHDRDILADSAARASSILHYVDVLAKGGELDSSTQGQALALVAARQANSAEGERVYYQSRIALALAMGFSPEQMASAPLVGGDFPSTVDPAFISTTMGHKFVHEALQRRGDHLAAGLSVNAEEALLLRVRRDLKPRVDLELSVGYAGYDDRRSNLRPLRSLGGDLSGPSAMGALSFEWPMPNNLARGELVTQRAETEQARLSAIRSANIVSSGVLTSLETLRRAIEQSQFTNRAVQVYQKTVTQTNDKMKAGEAVVTELIDVEDRYAEARRVHIDTMRRYSIALAQLRLNTGSLSSLSDDRAVFQIEDFITVPFTP